MVSAITYNHNGRQAVHFPPYRGEEAAPPGDEARVVRGLFKSHDSAHEQVAQVFGRLARENDTAAVACASLAVVHSFPESKRKSSVEQVYAILRERYCTTPLGVTTGWPDGFWDTNVGKLIYVAFHDAYDEDLILNQDVAERLGIDLSRVGQIERLGLLHYIENPWVHHRMQRRRRVSPHELEAYRAKARKE
jgi:hypothetical protein